MYKKSSNSHSSHLISGFWSSFSLANLPFLPFPETSKSFQIATSSRVLRFVGSAIRGF